MTEDEMVGCHHRLNGHEFAKTPGDSRQGSLECCSPWGCKELNTTERLNNNSKRIHSRDFPGSPGLGLFIKASNTSSLESKVNKI